LICDCKYKYDFVKSKNLKPFNYKGHKVLTKQHKGKTSIINYTFVLFVTSFVLFVVKKNKDLS